MRALVLEPSEQWLAERRRKGHDRFDEVWDGVLHMVPPPSENHQRVGVDLLALLKPIAEKRGLLAYYETGLFRPKTDKDFRQPDQMYVRPELRTERGIDGAADFVVEILSRNDETYEKIPFYESLGVKELLVLDPTSRTPELFVLRGGKLLVQAADATGALRSQVLGVALRVVDGPKLRIEWDGGLGDV